MRSPPPPLPWRPLLRFILTLAILTPSPAAAADLASDAAALAAFRAAVGPRVAWNVTSPTTVCSWTGVSCTGPRVTALRLPAAALAGPIPAGTLGNLTALQTLSLRYNALSGALPADLAAAADLRGAFLNDNRLTGDFPPAFLAMPGLTHLALGGNSLSGAIPPALANLTRLRVLLLESNRFAGAIPDLPQPSLQQLNVSFNQLNGSVPPSLRSQPRSAFLGMASLCGAPLPACPGEQPSPPPSPTTQPSSPTPTPPSPTTTTNNKNKLSGGAIAGIAIGAVIGAALLLLLLICLCRRSTRTKTRALEMPPPSPAAIPAGGGRKPPETTSSAAIAPLAGMGHPGAPMGGQSTSGKKLVFFRPAAAAVQPFDLEDLLRASAEVLGKGAIGTTYKAVLESGATVAVKRLKDVNMTEPEFRERIADIGELQHEFIVPLRAYYFSKDEKLLVSDFMPMGSLSALLHGNRGSGRTPLNWPTRASIALAAARGIEYIHSTSSTTSHGNIKSSNILLGKSYQARVSDNGLATLVGSSSAPLRATGYRAPEVTDPRRVSQKADVYSFGVLLLELLTGKAPSQAALNDEGVDLPRWVQSVVRSEWTAEVFDMELLRHQDSEEQMVQLLQLAIDCVAQVPDARPTMSHVVVRIDEIKRSSESVEGTDQQQDALNQAEDDDQDETVEGPAHLAP
ncbi:probable inactive receptor kinase At1g48480 [Lolium rigidum]|uniref:probable inactive receptor kinase At1g48480 n=1 Tax=Lolium rigidum TaxID=89674 RepID=UPI001F5DEF53|nr:probable inactive receptor kinase At1g48480 [Lolium rigidum]